MPRAAPRSGRRTELTPRFRQLLARVLLQTFLLLQVRQLLVELLELRAIVRRELRIIRARDVGGRPFTRDVARA
jgi:hypothetical protein